MICLEQRKPVRERRFSLRSGKGNVYILMRFLGTRHGTISYRIQKGESVCEK